MTETAALLIRFLQLSDSALPIGRYAQSLGLEDLLDSDPNLGEREFVEIVQSLIMMGASRLDGVAVATAHRMAAQGDVQGLVALDRAVTARKLSPSARRASHSCGRQLASLAITLSDDPTISSFCKAVRSGEADGNLPVVEGALAAAMQLPQRWAVLMELRSCAAALTSAAVRLGRLSATRAQAVLRDCEDVIARACSAAIACPLDEMSSSAVELEIYAMRHSASDCRLFMT